jgi:hypothetical protein
VEINRWRKSSRYAVHWNLAGLIVVKGNNLSLSGIEP